MTAREGRSLCALFVCAGAGGCRRKPICRDECRRERACSVRACSARVRRSNIQHSKLHSLQSKNIEEMSVSGKKDFEEM